MLQIWNYILNIDMISFFTKKALFPFIWKCTNISTHVHFQKIFAIWNYEIYKPFFIIKKVMHDVWCMMHANLHQRNNSFFPTAVIDSTFLLKIVPIIYVNFLMKKKGFLYMYFIYSFKLQCLLKWVYIFYIYHIHMVYNKYILPPASLLICRFKTRFFRNSSFGLRRSSTSSSSEEDGA